MGSEAPKRLVDEEERRATEAGVIQEKLRERVSKMHQAAGNRHIIIEHAAIICAYTHPDLLPKGYHVEIEISPLVVRTFNTSFASKFTKFEPTTTAIRPYVQLEVVSGGSHLELIQSADNSAVFFVVREITGSNIGQSKRLNTYDLVSAKVTRTQPQEVKTSQT